MRAVYVCASLGSQRKGKGKNCKWDVSDIFIQVCFANGFISAKYLEPSCLYHSKLCVVSLNSKEMEIIGLSNVIMMIMLITINIHLYSDFGHFYSVCGKLKL